MAGNNNSKPIRTPQNEVIINGVDVSGCIYFKKNNKMPMCKACNSGIGSPYCEYHKDCYYKQLKHKEQEYEILNIEIEDIAEARMEICNQCGGRDDYNIPCKQIRDLDYGLQLEIEENDKLKQTLAEIKEIAENAYCLTNYTNKDMAQFAKLILQKISECGVEDELY